MVVSLSQHLKKKLEENAQRFGCSQAEVLRIALVRIIEAERGV
jgi:predicted tellurium resistance membrane protein TerC